MKFSVCAIDREVSSEAPFPLRGKSFRECARIAESLGFNGIELQIQNPSEHDGKELRRVLEFYGLQASAVTTGLAYSNEGLSLTHIDPEIRERSIERMKRQLDLARELDSQILIGYMRGRKAEGMSDSDFEDILTDSLGRLAEYGASIKTRVCLEQLRLTEGDVFNSMDRTVSFIEKLNSEWLVFSGDTYHMMTEDDDIAASIKRAMPKMTLFHVADEERLLPDDRHFDFRKAAETLIAENYTNWVTLEVKPIPDSRLACLYGIAYLKRTFRPES